MKYLPLLALTLLAAPAFADDINASAKPLSNATTTVTTVPLNCEIQADASLNNCQLEAGAKVSKTDEAKAIGQVAGKGHVAGAFVAGKRTHVIVRLDKGDGLHLIPIG